MKSIYTLVGMAVLAAVLGLSIVPASAADEFEDAGEVRINDALYYYVDAS